MYSNFRRRLNISSSEWGNKPPYLDAEIGDSAWT